MIVLLPLLAELLWNVAGGSPASVPRGPADAQTIRMDVGLVVLHATVTDKKGNSVSGLTQSAFKLIVDDRPQPIKTFQGDDAPVAAGIIVDNSASMAPVRSEVIASSLDFARASNPLDQTFVIHVSDSARLALPSDEPFTSKIPVLEAALSTFHAAGTTALYDGAALGVAHLEKASISRRVLLIISDGGDNSSHMTLHALIRLAQQSQVSIYCIGLPSQEQKPDILKQISEETNGKAFFPTTAADISKITVQIAKEIRAEYTVAFNDLHDGKYHRITLTAEDAARGPLTVRTRAGFTSETP